jgi:hypothetical protein
LSGFGKRGIGAYSETRKQFHEFGAQSIAARRGERVKRKKRQFDVLGQHVILRRNVPSVPQSLGRRATPSLCFLLFNQKALGPPTRCWFRYRGKNTADLIAEGDYVVGRWEGGGTHTGPAFSDFLIGSLPAATGRKMRFTGTTVLRLQNGKIVEEIGLDDGVTALTQLGLLKAA